MRRAERAVREEEEEEEVDAAPAHTRRLCGAVPLLAFCSAVEGFMPIDGGGDDG